MRKDCVGKQSRGLCEKSGKVAVKLFKKLKSLEQLFFKKSKNLFRIEMKFQKLRAEKQFQGSSKCSQNFF